MIRRILAGWWANNRADLPAACLLPTSNLSSLPTRPPPPPASVLHPYRARGWRAHIYICIYIPTTSSRVIKRLWNKFNTWHTHYFNNTRTSYKPHQHNHRMLSPSATGWRWEGGCENVNELAAKGIPSNSIRRQERPERQHWPESIHRLLSWVACLWNRHWESRDSDKVNDNEVSQVWQSDRIRQRETATRCWGNVGPPS